MAIAPDDVVRILLPGFGPPSADVTAAHQAVVLSIRLPRILLTIIVGAGLATAGAVLQGLFRNPLADPGLIGVSMGAATAAVGFIIVNQAAASFFPSSLQPLLLPACAFAGGLAVTLLVQRLATRQGEVQIATMLLAGIAANAMCQALIGFFIFLSDDEQLRELEFWMLGSLAGAQWKTLLPALVFILVPLICLPRMGRALNALLLGESEASYLGFDVERLKRRMIVLVALATGTAVAVSGVIGFLGLVTPHLVRLAIGPDHRHLIPASALLGACLLLFADMIARTIVLPAEMPIGIVTALIGGPFFLWLLTRQSTRSW